MIAPIQRKGAEDSDKNAKTQRTQRHKGEVLPGLIGSVPMICVLNNVINDVYGAFHNTNNGFDYAG
jgi:hypothetical protein